MDEERDGAEPQDPDFGLLGGPDPDAGKVPEFNGISRPAFRAWLGHPCGQLLQRYLTEWLAEAKGDSFQLWLDGRFDQEPGYGGEARGKIAMLMELCPIRFEHIVSRLTGGSPPDPQEGGEGEHGTETPLQAEDGDRHL